MQESRGPSELKPKQPNISVKIKKVNDHFLVSFKYNEDIIFHTLEELLDAITLEVKRVLP